MYIEEEIYKFELILRTSFFSSNVLGKAAQQVHREREVKREGGTFLKFQLPPPSPPPPPTPVQAIFKLAAMQLKQ